MAAISAENYERHLSKLNSLMIQSWPFLPALHDQYTIAMLGYADEYETTVLELTYNYDVTEYTKGNAYAQIALSTEDVYKTAQVVDLVTKELGGKITRQPGPIPGINTKITSFLDPDGWKVVFVDHADFLKELEA